VFLKRNVIDISENKDLKYTFSLWGIVETMKDAEYACLDDKMPVILSICCGNQRKIPTQIFTLHRYKWGLPLFEIH
jgi:hypothetical protein